MTWAASVHPRPGGLVLRFDRPVWRVEMTDDEARHLALLLLVGAERTNDDEQEATGT